MFPVIFDRTLTFVSFLGQSLFCKASAEKQHFKVVTAAVLWMQNVGLKMLQLSLEEGQQQKSFAVVHREGGGAVLPVR